jgi:uncharacterized protein
MVGMQPERKENVMAGQNNPGQFGNRDDPEEQASSGSFGSGNSVNSGEARRKGARAQSTETKAEGGANSHQGSNG